MFSEIDVVYTWVDGSDPALAEKVAHYRKLEGNAAGPVGSQLRDLGELRYSLRTVCKFMPWVRHIYVVTNGQVPDFIDWSDKRIKLARHCDFFADPGVLPVFSSLAIEANLHRIEGLSEAFIYFNNDVFVGAPVEVEDFFTPQGEVMRFEFRKLKSAGDDMYSRLLSYNDNLICRRFGDHLRYANAHTPQPFLRSRCFEIEESWADEARKASASRFRIGESLHFRVAYMYYWSYKLFGPMGVDRLMATTSQIRVPSSSEFKHFALSSGDPDMRGNLARLVQSHPKFFCLQDHLWESIDDVSAMLAEELSKLAPESASFER